MICSYTYLQNCSSAKNEIVNSVDSDMKGSHVRHKTMRSTPRCAHNLSQGRLAGILVYYAGFPVYPTGRVVVQESARGNELDRNKGQRLSYPIA